MDNTRSRMKYGITAFGRDRMEAYAAGAELPDEVAQKLPEIWVRRLTWAPEEPQIPGAYRIGDGCFVVRQAGPIDTHCWLKIGSLGRFKWDDVFDWRTSSDEIVVRLVAEAPTPAAIRLPVRMAGRDPGDDSGVVVSVDDSQGLGYTSYLRFGNQPAWLKRAETRVLRDTLSQILASEEEGR